MPDVKVSIGGRDFDVACQAGEEHYLRAAAQLLDNEATALAGQIGRLPESRMLLMAGLMLADKTAGLDEQLRATENRLAKLQAEIETLRSSAPPEPQRVEVPVIPQSVTEMLAELAAQAEALAEGIEEKVGT